MKSGEDLCVIAIIENQRGLHARAAAKFVKLAESFSADIFVTKDDMRVSARSIMGLMMLAATKGSTIHISGSGTDAATELQTMSEFVKRKFDEE